MIGKTKGVGMKKFTKKQIKILQKQWKKFLKIDDEFWRKLNKLEKETSKLVGVKDIDFFYCDNECAGIGDYNRKMKLIQHDEIEKGKYESKR